MPRWTKISLITLAVIFALLLLSMLIVPWQIKKQGPAWIAANTTRVLTIDKAFFNPFALTVEISGVTLSEQNEQKTFVSFDRFMFSASVRSLIHRALILDRVELDRPYLNIELLGKQEFNFSDFTRLGGDRPPQAAAEPSKPLHFSLNNIIITAGSVDFTDRTSAKKSQHQIRRLALSVPFIGNMPYLTEEYVQPHLNMLLNGSEVRASGQLKPFHDSLETKLFLSLDGVDLPFYAFHSPFPLPLEVKTGSLDCEIDLAYRISRSEEPQLLFGGELALSDLDLRELDGRELLRVPTLILDLDWADLFNRNFNLAGLEIYEPELFVNREATGRWNFQRIVDSADASAAPGAEEAVATESQHRLPLLFIEKLGLHDGRLHFRDDFVPGGFSEDITAVNIALDELSTHPGQTTVAASSLRTGRDFNLTVTGELGLNPLATAVAVTADGLQIEPFYPYLEEFLTAPVAGLLNLSGQFNYTPEGNVLMQNAQLAMQNLRVPFAADDGFTLASLSIGNSSFDRDKKQLGLGAIRLQNGDMRLSRLADGDMSPLKLLKQPETKDIPAEQAAATAAAETEAEAPWNISATSFDLRQLELLYTDQTRSKKPQLAIPRVDLHAENLSYPQQMKTPFRLAAKIGARGTVDLSGSAAHSPLRLDAEAQTAYFPLADFNDFIPENLHLSLKNGQLFSSAAVTLKQQGQKLTGKFSAAADVNNFNLRDPLGDGELLAWESLNLDGIDGNIGPFALHIKDVALSNYRTNIQITADGRINLTSITAPEEQPETAATGGQEEQSAGPPPDIRIDALTLQGGTVSFIDRSMDRVFSATMYELGGRVTGMASDEQMQADVDLRGQLENHSPLTVSGKINPLSKDLFADLTISFKDIDLTPLTPYSGTYLGYVIDKGKLYLDLSYHIEKRKVSADNKVLIDQFTLGDRVESDKATALPIGLAIALLKDNNDEIHLDIPVYGDLDDPNFSVVGVIFTVVRNLLVKAATSPFSLLSSVLGGGDKDFTSVTFAGGLAVIGPEQLTQLQKLAEMLVQRPSLTLEISAFADRDNDPESYRQEQLRQMLIAAKRDNLTAAGSAPAAHNEVTFSAEEYPELILQVYEEAEFPRPRNVVGMLTRLPVEEMEKLLLANIRAGDEEMRQLAKARAMAVQSTLVAANEKVKPQLFLTQPDIYQPPKEGPAGRVEFKISAK